MLNNKEKLELEELEKFEKSLSKKDNKELEDSYEYDNRLGAFLLLVSYCGIGVFILYKIAELLVKQFS